MEVISKEDVLKEMNVRVSEVVQYFSEKSKREQAIRDAARFLGISNSQTKCFFYNQSTRIDAHVADQIRVRTDQYLHQLDEIRRSGTEKNNRPDHSVFDLNSIHDSALQTVTQSWSWEELSIEKTGGIASDILSIFDRSNRRKDNSFKALSNLKISENISLIDRSLIYRMHDDFNDGFYCYSGRAIGVPAITDQGMTIRESPSTGDSDTLVKHIQMLKIRKKPILMKIVGGSGEDGRVWEWTRLGLPLPNRTNQFLHVILRQDVIG